MQYSATAKYIRMGPRKLRLLADSIRRTNAVQTAAMLDRLPKRSAKPMRDVIMSAIANAKSKNAQVDSLVIDLIDVMEGPVMKRWHAVSKGSAHGYKKQMTHIRIVLKDREKRDSEKKVVKIEKVEEKPKVRGKK